MKPYCFFSHVAFGIDPRAHAAPHATANLLIEIDDKTLTSSVKKKRLKVSDVSQKAELAGKIAMAAAASMTSAAKSRTRQVKRQQESDGSCSSIPFPARFSLMWIWSAVLDRPCTPAHR